MSDEIVWGTHDIGHFFRHKHISISIWLRIGFQKDNLTTGRCVKFEAQNAHIVLLGSRTQHKRKIMLPVKWQFPKNMGNGYFCTVLIRLINTNLFLVNQNVPTWYAHGVGWLLTLRGCRAYHTTVDGGVIWLDVIAGRRDGFWVL